MEIFRNILFACVMFMQEDGTITCHCPDQPVQEQQIQVSTEKPQSTSTELWNTAPEGDVSYASY